MAVTTRSARSTRSRSLAAASGIAALALVLSACGEEGDAEQAVGEATSAVGSVAAEATSAVGDATNDDGEGDTGATTGNGPRPEDSEEGAGEGDTGATTGNGPRPEDSEEGAGEDENPDEAFLSNIRQLGVDTEDEQDYVTRGRDACTSLDEGVGYTDVLGQYNDAHSEAPVTEAPIVVTAAIEAFCPQHLPLVGDDDGGA